MTIEVDDQGVPLPGTRAKWLDSALSVMPGVPPPSTVATNPGETRASTPLTEADLEPAIASAGTWNSVVTYYRNNLVTYLGQVYRALKLVPGGSAAPEDSVSWELWVAKGSAQIETMRFGFTGSFTSDWFVGNATHANAAGKVDVPMLTTGVYDSIYVKTPAPPGIGVTWTWKVCKRATASGVLVAQTGSTGQATVTGSNRVTIDTPYTDTMCVQYHSDGAGPAGVEIVVYSTTGG